MSQRVSQLGGTLSIESSAGQGTAIAVSIPISVTTPAPSMPPTVARLAPADTAATEPVRR